MYVDAAIVLTAPDAHLSDREQLDADRVVKLKDAERYFKDATRMTLPLFRVALNPRFTRPFYAVPRTSAARTASG